MVRKGSECFEEEPWQAPYLEFLSGRLVDMVNRSSMEKLSDITSALFSDKTEILGELALVLIKKRYRHLLDQEQCACPQCGKVLKRRGFHKRQVETMVGAFELERPYFYCVPCEKGFYPLDATLGLSPSARQHDVQETAAWLAAELPFNLASEALERCTGIAFSPSGIHECVDRIASELGPEEVCPSRAEVEEKIATFSEGKRCRPVMMLTVDGANAPVRPEPSPRKGKRGKGEYKEVKGLRLYLVDGQRIEQLVSWHRIGSDQELSATLRTIKDAGLVPEKRVRLCVVADGAAWIWNRVKEIFPNAREVLDYFHCSEHLHELAAAQYGKVTLKALEWVQATQLRLFLKQKRHVIAGIKRMQPASSEAARLIDKTAAYLQKHSNRLDYGSARRGGYHIGSGAIESANKLICHTRLKRPGAWWYPTKANNILKLRCAKYNQTFARVIKRHRDRDSKSISENGPHHSLQRPDEHA
jgi:hypothetical protein